MGTAHLLQLLSLLTGMSVLQRVRSWSITVPRVVTAVEGSCVVVPCQTQSHSRVVWYQYHGMHYPVVYDGRNPTNVEVQFRGRTSVLGKAAEGNCTLMITNVERRDNNLIVYVWINPDSKPAQKFHLQTVTIFVERKAPLISIQKHMVDGDIFQANCSIKYSCPFSPPFLDWNTSPFLKNSTSMAFSEDVLGQWSYTKTLQGLATYEMHNRKMWCSAKFRTLTTESQQITLNILYKPVTVTLILEEEPIVEGGSVTMECAADCNPQPHTYIWLKRQMGRNKEITSTERKRSFNHITRDISVSCIAYNDIGPGMSDWVDLDVQYAPVILPESSCDLTGEALKCVCQAEASPEASMYWTIDENDTLPSSFSIVSANVVSGEIHVYGPAQSQSNISCTAINSLGSNTKQLSVDFSNTSSLYLLLSVLMLLGIGLLFGCAMFIYRKHSGNRPQSSSDDVRQEQTYTTLRRSQNEDAQSRPCRRDKSNPEVDRLSCVYDNECVEGMSRGLEQRYAEAPKEKATYRHRQRCSECD